MSHEARISVGQSSLTGRKDRNDDSYGVVVPAAELVTTHGIAIAIADGMSSSEGAKEASECCVKSFLEDYYATHASWSVKRSAATVLKAVNSWLYAQGQSRHDSERGMVSTFSGVILKSGTAHIFHAGDSRVSRIRDGRIEQWTRDHRLKVGRGHEHLSRAIGIDQHVEVDYRSEPIEAGDILVLTTDGVHDHVHPPKIAALIAEHPADLEMAARSIAEHALACGSLDNITCQIVRIDDPGRPDETGHLGQLSTLPFPPELAPGMTFDGYRIVRELHTSNRTQVYLAEDAKTGNKVVLKTPSVNFEDDPAYIAMFAREEWIGHLVASPHVLKVLPQERARRHLYTVTEYFEGQTLRQWMRDNSRPDLEAVRRIVDQIAKGLRAFHRKDILHQDLKPENIMIDGYGHVKIIDFGSARASGLDELTPENETQALLGTVDYIAPEYHAGERPTNRADIFALGAITYELLSGHLPYGKGFGSPRDVNRLAYVSARQLRDDIPVWMDAALEKAVHKRPNERTDALSALVEDLRRPNAALGYDRPRPLLERNPAGFWRTLALVLLAINVVLLYRLMR